VILIIVYPRILAPIFCCIFEHLISIEMRRKMGKRNQIEQGIQRKQKIKMIRQMKKILIRL